MGMQAGKLDRRIQLLTVSEEVDASGGPKEVVTPYGPKIWARAYDLTGREFIAAQQINAEITTKFTVRFRSDITTRMRVQWRDRQYDIVAIPEVGSRDDGLDILARARV